MNSDPIIFGRFVWLLTLLCSTVVLLFIALLPVLILPFILVGFLLLTFSATFSFTWVKTKTQKLE